MQYFWLWIFAYEVSPEEELVEQIISQDIDEDVSTMEEEPIAEELSPWWEEQTDAQNTWGTVVFSWDGSENNVNEDLLDQEPIDEWEYTGFSTQGDSIYDEEDSVLPLLIMTELYFGWTDERFEIYNPHDIPFVWSIQVVGVKSSILTINNLTIPSKTARIFGNNMSMISDLSVIERSALGLSISDSKAIAIDVLFNGGIVDRFVANTSIMNASNKTPRASLHRTLDDINIIHISPVVQNYNTTNPASFTINPGIVYDSLAQQAPAACESRWSTIQIREMFRWTQAHAPYIELFAPQWFNQNITIGGTLLDEEFTVSIDQPAGHYHLAAIAENNYTAQPFVSDNQELSFGSNLGNIIIYWQSGQVLDKVDVIVKEDGYASYVRWQWCQRVADVVDNFSPGFPRQYLSYFPEGAEKVINVTQQIIVPASWWSCSGDVQTESIEAIATGDFVMDFISIDYDPIGSDTNRESIVLRSLVDYPLDLSVYALRLSTRNWLQYLRWVLEPEEEITLTGNFRFPNAGACVDLLYADFIVDTYCYPVVWNWSGEVENDYSDVSITIDTLVYDPPGDDTNNEEITFTVHTGSIDFSDGFYVLINGRKYNLSSFSGQRTGTLTLKANYRMPNTQNACVSLLRGDFVFDTKCYVIPTKSSHSTNTNNTTINTDRFSYKIRIDAVDYDPDWSDTSNEKITLVMDNGSPVDLAQFHILINGTKKKLKDTLTLWTPLTLIGTYWFPNTKQTCIILQYQDHVYDTYCYDPGEDKKKEQEAVLRSWTIAIRHIEYDPIGNDADREEIHLMVDWPIIDLTQWRHLLVNTTKKSLSKYWSIASWSISLTGTFSFPNTKDSCVSIRQYETMFDEYCYQISKAEKQETAIYTGVWLTILAVLPNPVGADSGKERVEVSLSNPSEVDLAQWFTLLINGSKKKLTGVIAWSDPYRITGSFAIPNTASCISLFYLDSILDTFCYPQTKEAIVYTKNSQTLIALTDAELALLKNTSLTKIGNKVCLMLSQATIKCRAIPGGKLASRQMEELKLSRNYITMMHDYLYNHWQVIYFNTDVSAYKTLFDSAKKDISSSKFTWTYGSEKLPISDIQTRFQLQYQQPLLQQLQWQLASKIFAPKFAKNYQKAKERYYKNMK